MSFFQLLSATEISLYTVITALLAGIVTCLFWKKYTDCYKTIYCPFNIPLVGSAMHLEREPEKLTKQIADLIFEGNRYIFMLWLAWVPTIYGGTAEISEAVLKSKEHLQKSNLYNFLHEWLGTGLLTSTGDKWTRRRKALTPAFHFSKLLNFIDTFEEKGSRLVSYFKKYAETGELVDVQIPASLMALESICKSAMGVDINSLDSSCSDYVYAVRSMSSELQYRQRSPWFWSDFIYGLTKRGKTYFKNLKLLHDFTINVINQRLESYKNDKAEISNDEKGNIYSSTSKTDFLQSLIELYEKNEIDLEGIREEVDTFMFEGHDTTAALVAFCFFLIGNDQQCQEKLQNEIDHAEGNTLLERIQNMKYLDNVVKETLRLSSPVPIIGRYIEKDCIINNTKIYKGTEVFLLVNALHRNPKYWDAPHEFKPERFDCEDFLKRNPYCYIPFSAGPRNCIGQRYALLEAKIFISKVLSEYNLISREKDLLDVNITVELIMKAKNGLWIEFQKRK